MLNQIRIIASIGFLIILGYSSLWFTVAFEFEDQAAEELSTLRNIGMHVSYDDISLGGFPYRIALKISDLEITDPNKGYQYSSVSTEIVTHLWTPQHYVLQAEEVEASLFNGKLKLKDDYARASYRHTDDDKIIIAADSYTNDDISILKAPNLLQTTGLNEWQVFLRMHKTPLAPASSLYEDRFVDFKIVLGGSKGNIEAIGGVSGKPVYSWNKTNLSEWRDSGGLLTLDAINFSLGGAKLEGNGSLTLDEKLKLLGSLGFKTRRNLTDQHYARLNRFLKANHIQNFTLTPQALKAPLGLTFQNGQLAIGNQTLQSINSVID